MSPQPTIPAYLAKKQEPPPGNPQVSLRKKAIRSIDGMKLAAPLPDGYSYDEHTPSTPSGGGNYDVVKLDQMQVLTFNAESAADLANFIESHPNSWVACRTESEDPGQDLDPSIQVYACSARQISDEEAKMIVSHFASWYDVKQKATAIASELATKQTLSNSLSVLSNTVKKQAQNGKLTVQVTTNILEKLESISLLLNAPIESLKAPDEESSSDEDSDDEDVDVEVFNASLAPAEVTADDF